MRRHKWLVLAIGLLMAADAPKGDAAKKDREKLQGTWRVVSIEADGKKEPADFARRFTYTFKGDRIHFLGDNTTPGADLEFTYTLDASKKPKTIDMKLVKSADNKRIGMTTSGIYALDGDNLKICAGEKERPTQFGTKGKSHTALVVLKREKK